MKNFEYFGGALTNPTFIGKVITRRGVTKNYLLQAKMTPLQACSDHKKPMLKKVKINLNLTVTYNMHIFFLFEDIYSNIIN